MISKYSPFLKEARKRVLLVLIIFSIASISGFAFYEDIIKFLINFLNLEGVNIVFTSPFQFINLAISCGAAIGLTASFPFLVYQILSFLRPALREKEYRMIVSFIPFSIFLFSIGFLFGSLIMKWQIQIFLESSIGLGIGNVLDISRLLTVVLLVSAFLGIGFQFPIVLLVLMRMGILKHEALSKIRMWVYLASFFFAVLLPIDSIPADVLLALPLVLLFEATLLIDKLLSKKEVAVVSV